MQPVRGPLRLSIFEFGGKLIQDLAQAVTVPALSSQVYMEFPLSDFGAWGVVDPARVVAVAQFDGGGRGVSRNLTYLVPTKQVHLPEAQISVELTSAAEGYHLELSSPVLARSVYVSFGDATAELSDNYFDLLPNQPADLLVKSAETLDALRAKLKVVSLADAFKAADTSK